MKARFAAAGIVFAAVTCIVGAYWWYRTPDQLVRCYSRITGGMTITQVREVIGHSVDEFISKSDTVEWQSHLQRRQHGVSEDYEMKMEKKDGSTVWTVISATPLYDEDGKWIGSAGMVRDVEITRDTSRFLAAREEALQTATANLEQTILQRTQELRQSQSFLDSLIENLPNMVFVKDAKELRFVRFNRAGEDLLGFSRSELIGKNDYDFFPKEQADFFTRKDRDVLAGRLT